MTGVDFRIHVASLIHLAFLVTLSVITKKSNTFEVKGYFLFLENLHRHHSL